MARAPYQVLVIPFRRINSSVEFCLLKRSDDSNWQFVSGGGEGAEKPEQAAVRETSEELGIKTEKLIKLDAVASVPAKIFKDWVHWPEDTYVIPEYSFAVDITAHDFTLSSEHTSFEWHDFKAASKLLKWDSNRTALWELNERLVLK